MYLIIFSTHDSKQVYCGSTFSTPSLLSSSSSSFSPLPSALNRGKEKNEEDLLFVGGRANTIQRDERPLPPLDEFLQKKERGVLFKRMENPSKEHVHPG